MRTTTNDIGLTDLQQAFINEYAKSKNGTQSYIKAGYKVENNKVACYSAFKLLRKPYIRSAIDNILQKKEEDLDISTSFILNGIKEIAINGKKEADKLKAFELLGKNRRLFIDIVESKNLNVNEEISKMSDIELCNAISKIEAISQANEVSLPAGDLKSSE
jgi:phage terminase small subunit